MTEHNELQTTVSSRMSRFERQLIKAAASAEGTTMSAWLRRTATTAARKVLATGDAEDPAAFERKGAKG